MKLNWKLPLLLGAAGAALMVPEMAAFAQDAAAPAVPGLIEALRDPLESVRIGAAEALGAIGPAAVEAIPHLQAARNNNQSVMSWPVQEALARIRPVAPAAASLARTGDAG